MLRRRALCLALLSLGACKKPPPPPPPLPTVRVVAVQKRAIEQTREWLATLDGSTNAEIRPHVDGYIQSVDYREGSVVQRGTLLFSLDKRPFIAAVEKAKGDLENARAQLDKSRGDVKRYAPLVAEHALPREQLEDAQAAARANSALVRSMKGTLDVARLNLEWAEVRSPITGLAGIAQTRVGNLVGSTQVLTVVSTVDPIRASVNIGEREYLQYATVFNNINDPRYAERRYLELVLINGRVHPYVSRRVIVGRQINPQTGTLLLQALFPNPGNILRPGLFAKIRVHTAQPEPTLVVPELAVQQLQGQTQVAVLDGEDRVQLRPIELGRQFEHEYEVLRGLKTGERVVLSGLQTATPGQKVHPELVQESERQNVAGHDRPEGQPDGATEPATDGATEPAPGGPLPDGGG